VENVCYTERKSVNIIYLSQKTEIIFESDTKNNRIQNKLQIFIYLNMVKNMYIF